MNIITYNGRQPCHIRLRMVASSSFEFQIEEWDYLDQRHLTETIAYVVVEQGAPQLSSGVRLEAGTLPVGENWRTVIFRTGYSYPPAAISQSQTVNNSQVIITRQRGVTTAGFDVCLQQEEANAGTPVIETVGCLAMEQR